MKLAKFTKLSFGNIIEWYDFSLYIYFACFIANDFFPNNSPFVKMLLTFSTFFLGSMARPIGGVLSGWLSDKYHSVTIINICVKVMAVSTFLIALLPDYKHIGILAPLLLTMLRIIQGLSAGGQMPSLISLSADQYEDKNGMVIGLSFSISTIGFLLASILGFVLTNYFSDYNTQVLWRVAFAASAILFLLYLYINRNEHYAMVAPKNNTKTRSVFSALKNQMRAVVCVILLTTMCSSLYYVVFTYLINYQIEQLHYAPENVFLLNSIVLVLACLTYPMFGHLADKIGRYKLFYYSVFACILLLWPSISLINSSNQISSLLGLCILTLLISAIQGGVSPLFANLFEPEWRTAGCAVSYSIGNALGGGAPLLALSLVHATPEYGLYILVIFFLFLGSYGIFIANNENHGVRAR
jgi:MFS family permease